MIETYKCIHGKSEILIGSTKKHICYCRQCKSEIFSQEEIKKREDKIAIVVAKNKKNINRIIKNIAINE